MARAFFLGFVAKKPLEPNCRKSAPLAANSDVSRLISDQDEVPGYQPMRLSQTQMVTEAITQYSQTPIGTLEGCGDTEHVNQVRTQEPFVGVT